MAQKKVYSPCRPIKNWLIVSYESTRFFPENGADRMAQDLISEARNMGKLIRHPLPASLITMPS